MMKQSQSELSKEHLAEFMLSEAKYSGIACLPAGRLRHPASRDSSQ
ncbi:MAG: hypothetical protein ABIJ27_07315 [Candidatus Omnitrophota bacterium]